MKKIIFILIAGVFLQCGTSQKEIEDLISENNSLKEELNDCKFGSKKLLIKANRYFKKKEYAYCFSTLNNLIDNYSGTTEIIDAEKLMKLTNLKIDSIRKSKIKEKIEIQKKTEKVLANVTKKMRKSYDDFNDITWYYDKSSPKYISSNGFFIYIAHPTNGEPSLRLKIQYKSDSWLFIEKYTIKCDDKTFFIKEEKYGEIDTDNGSGNIYEWLDRNVSSDELEIINSVVNSKKSKIRFHGKQYYSDKVITSKQKQALRNVLAVYKWLGGKL